MPNLNISNLDSYINQYYKRLNDYKQVNSRVESSTETAMKMLLTQIAENNNLVLIKPTVKRGKTHIIYDGIIRRKVDNYDFGYWEAKDTKDDLDREIEKKIEKGYTKKNIIFENTEYAVLYQQGNIVGERDIRDKENLKWIIIKFFEYDQGIYDRFQTQKEIFVENIEENAGKIFITLEERKKESNKFNKALSSFHSTCQKALNPNVSIEDVERMLVQHIMTEQIFEKIMDDPAFFDENEIAKSINSLLDDFYDRPTRLELTKNLHLYYDTISKLAYQMPSFEEKQRLLNEVYEIFFKSFSEKDADRLGIVYTPTEIVDFILESVNDTLKKEFGKTLASKGIHILDPCVGTGNFIVHLLQKISEIDITNLKHKYDQEIHCNEIMLLPYYIANMNIEKTFEEIDGTFREFEGICLTDSLELLSDDSQYDFLTEENTKRIETQKEKDIFVILGNPPYNMGQSSENEANKNKKTDYIDNRIKETYAKESQATLKNKLYDPYVKFFRFATDRLNGKDGVICFVSNNSFLEQIAFDGFRKELVKDFNHVCHLDLHGDVRKNPKLSGTKHNVFGIQVGVGITILSRNKKESKHHLLYHRVDDFWDKNQKLQFIKNSQSFDGISFNEIEPNKKGNWFADKLGKGYDDFLPIAGENINETIFNLVSPGVSTNRFKLVYDFNIAKLLNKVKKLIDAYNQEVERWEKQSPSKKTVDKIDQFVDNENPDLEWDETLKKYLMRTEKLNYKKSLVRESIYKPFVKKYLYFDRGVNARVSQFPKIFPSKENDNIVIAVNGVGHDIFAAMIFSEIVDLATVKTGNGGTQCFPLYRYDEDGSNDSTGSSTKKDNITDWSLEQFKNAYQSTDITKEDVFYYIYAVLHHQEYRETFKENLKIELPRIPFIRSVEQDRALTLTLSQRERGQEEIGVFMLLSGFGRELADIHLHYEEVDEYEGLSFGSEQK